MKYGRINDKLGGIVTRKWVFVLSIEGVTIFNSSLNVRASIHGKL